MQAEDLDVLIVGAGVSGVGMGSALKARCPDKRFVILERRHAIGGTWDLFRYPGVRSDSDMHTYGYAQRPWDETKVLADGATIRQYLIDTAHAHGLDTHLRHGMKIVEAAWSSAQQRWTLLAMGEHDGTRHLFRCRLLVMGTGYYDHDAGHTPDFPDLERFDGTVVHPQHWPPALDCRGQRVVVVGSGATAVTLVPALAESAAHVTMLQRSPSYYFSVPSRDGLTQALLHLLPRRRTFAFARWRNRVLALGLYAAARRWPHAMRRFLLVGVRRHLRGTSDMCHFTPAYEPWDQRLCIVPDADLFVAIRDGKASVDTDEIAGFDGRNVLLRSGRRLEADILVTATGLQIQLFGGMRITVDGQPYLPQQHLTYKGVLLEGLPNFAWIVGYTNASWTLKADLASGYLCRLIQHLDAHGLGVAVARDVEGCMLDESVMGNLNSGYIQRGGALMPRQGTKAPWRVTHHYPSDKAQLQDGPIDDGVLVFEPLLRDTPDAVNPVQSLQVA
jgi:cation diffusion facilitator CzcD-associated flavoprotein CzcO